MHVALFSPRWPPADGGSEAYARRLALDLAAHGHAVTVWTTTALDLEAFWSRHGGVAPAGETSEECIAVKRFAPVARVRGRRWVLKPISLLPIPTLQRLTLPCNPICPAMWRDAGRFAGPLDAVLAQTFPYSWPLACGLRLARRRGVPYLLTPFLHLGDPDDPRDSTRRAYTAPGLRSLLTAADRVFVQTPTESDGVQRLGVPAERVVLQGMGVDPADCTGGDRGWARRAWELGPDDVAVGHLANLSFEKGTVDLLAAAERAWRHGQRFKLILAGSEMPNFRRAWDRFAGKKMVVKLGPLDDAGRRDFYAGIDMFALPSRSDSFGLVLLEAWANGVPNVAYRAGGVADVIRNEEDGLLVRCGDLDGLAAAIGQLVGDAGMRQRFGETGRERIGRDFNWSDKLAVARRELGQLV